MDKEENKDRPEEKVYDNESVTLPDEPPNPKESKYVGGSNPSDPPNTKETKSSKKPPQNQKRARKKGEDQKDDKNN